MTAGLAAVIAVVVFVVVVGAVYLMSKKRAGHITPGEPDRVSADVVTGLMAELRKWQAEAAYWKSTAERLQGEIDRR